MEGVAREIEVDFGLRGGRGSEVLFEVDAEGAFRFEVCGEGGGDGLVSGETGVIAPAGGMVVGV